METITWTRRTPSSSLLSQVKECHTNKKEGCKSCWQMLRCLNHPTSTLHLQRSRPSSLIEETPLLPLQPKEILRKQRADEVLEEKSCRLSSRILWESVLICWRNQMDWLKLDKILCIWKASIVQVNSKFLHHISKMVLEA